MADVSRRVRIAIADDHPIFRDGLKRLLESEAGFEVVAEAADFAKECLHGTMSDGLKIPQNLAAAH